MQLQVLDCDYTLLNGRPLVRLFCKNIQGDTVVVFYNKFMPYFYLDTDGKDFDVVKKDVKDRFGCNVEIVDRTIPLGYQPKKKVLKIIGRDPSKTPEVRDYLKKFGVPYEADVLFKYRFMIDFGIRGMGWIEVKGKPARTSVVKCQAIEADEIKPIELNENAPLRYLSFDIECTTRGDRVPIPEKDPIIMISMKFNPTYKGKETMVLTSKFISGGHDVVCSENEEEMMKKFLEVVTGYDPDVLIGYNINNFDFPFVVGRMEEYNIPKALGRTSKPARIRKFMGNTNCSVVGRVIVDPYQILKNDPWVRLRRYNLATAAKELLGDDKLDVGNPKEMEALWNGKTADHKKLVDYCRKDSDLALGLVLKQGMIQKFTELSKVSGVLLQDSFGGQTLRLDTRIMHEFKNYGYIMPCRPDEKEMFRRKKERETAGLEGAIVLEPDVGLHSNGSVLVLDFTSLYPSIVCAYNICPTTLTTDKKIDGKKTPYGSKFVDPKIREGILPKMLKDFLAARRVVKKQMMYETDKKKKAALNDRQLALKTMANSTYGYTGYTRSKLYKIDLAASITSVGRENILLTKKLIDKEFGYKIVYGDTDSVFVKIDVTDLDEAQKTGEKVAGFVTNHLDGLDLKFEKIFKSFLILAKKRYAGWSFEKTPFGWNEKIYMKGIETVRRDWCPIVGETMSVVLDMVLKEGDIPKASKYVREVLKDVIDGKVPLEKLTIVKGLTKPVEAYDGVQAHVELAKKIIKRDPTRGKLVGERIGFVILRGNQMLSKRSEDPEYVKKHNLQIDPHYYIENQLMPPLERIFDACGVTKTELKEGSKQKNLFDMLGGRPKTPAQTVLDSYDSIACKKCDWEGEKPTLSGKCPKCDSQLFFKKGATLGKFVKI
jgi:DNA polymerase, archaea type